MTPEEICKYFPVGAVAIYPNNTAVVLRFSGNYTRYKQLKTATAEKKFIDDEKGHITKMSTKSIARLNFVAQSTQIEFKSMITLTYPKELLGQISGKNVKSHLNGALSMLRSRFGKDALYPFDYLWFLEFTARGMPHIHILTTVACITPASRMALATSWIKSIIPAGDDRSPEEDLEWSRVQVKAALVALHTKTWEIIRKEGGAKRYMSKYAGKTGQKKVPVDFRDVGRFWGTSKRVLPELVEIIPITEGQLRAEMEKAGKTSDLPVIPKFLWGMSFAEKFLTASV